MEEVKIYLGVPAPASTTATTMVPSHPMFSSFMAMRDDDKPIPKLQTSELIDAFISELKQNVDVIIPADMEDSILRKFELKYKDLLFDASNYSVSNYDRPDKEKASEIKEKLMEIGSYLHEASRNSNGGTDMMITTFENDEWGRDDMGFRVSVIVEFGGIIGYYIHVDYEQEFFI